MTSDHRQPSGRDFHTTNLRSDYLKELLAPLGSVQAPRSVAGEIREIDVWFAPLPQPTVEPSVLGLLGRMAASPCLMEPFRNAPTPTEIRNWRL